MWVKKTQGLKYLTLTCVCVEHSTKLISHSHSVVVLSSPAAAAAPSTWKTKTPKPQSTQHQQHWLLQDRVNYCSLTSIHKHGRRMMTYAARFTLSNTYLWRQEDRTTADEENWWRKKTEILYNSTEGWVGVDLQDVVYFIIM